MSGIGEFSFRPGTTWSLGRERHRFFDSLVSYLVAVAAIGSTLGAQSRLTSGAWRREESFILNATGRIADIGLVFYPFRVMEEISHDRWPRSLSFTIEGASPDARIQWDEREGPNLEGLLLRATFARYYEDVRPQLGSGPLPEVWRFGRAIRNAFVHDGTVQFQRAEDAPVSWRGIRYGLEERGRRIIGQDLAVVEVIALMREMDEFGRS